MFFLVTKRQQPVGAHVDGHLEFHNIYLGPDNLYRATFKSNKLTSTGYHSDVSYEHKDARNHHPHSPICSIYRRRHRLGVADSSI